MYITKNVAKVANQKVHYAKPRSKQIFVLKILSRERKWISNRAIQNFGNKKSWILKYHFYNKKKLKPELVNYAAELLWKYNGGHNASYQKHIQPKVYKRNEKPTKSKDQCITLVMLRTHHSSPMQCRRSSNTCYTYLGCSCYSTSDHKPNVS